MLKVVFHIIWYINKNMVPMREKYEQHYWLLNSNKMIQINLIAKDKNYSQDIKYLKIKAISIYP